LKLLISDGDLQKEKNRHRFALSDFYLHTNNKTSLHVAENKNATPFLLMQFLT